MIAGLYSSIDSALIERRYSRKTEVVSQTLKPYESKRSITARLKPCPDTLRAVTSVAPYRQGEEKEGREAKSLRTKLSNPLESTTLEFAHQSPAGQTGLRKNDDESKH